MSFMRYEDYAANVVQEMLKVDGKADNPRPNQHYTDSPMTVHGLILPFTHGFLNGDLQPALMVSE